MGTAIVVIVVIPAWPKCDLFGRISKSVALIVVLGSNALAVRWTSTFVTLIFKVLHE